ncbi:hypothetical protein J6590_027476 [Homalodisca vitripennis]|nr:hypothetical protein J6590_027476 [Homalodisca vitripennis]
MVLAKGQGRKETTGPDHNDAYCWSLTVEIIRIHDKLVTRPKENDVTNVDNQSRSTVRELSRCKSVTPQHKTETTSRYETRNYWEKNSDRMPREWACIGELEAGKTFDWSEARSANAIPGIGRAG